ncbi:hypothetical protein [Nitrosomonas sp.]|uniref:hypothetical protein n=1 Tax=Nitrosomonas sp. TaxID=42353 RepID=UPI00374DE3A7
MGIHAASGKLHWNYFLALERDLDVVSRYIEFCEPNFSVYSIELAHLLFAAASEVDIVAKLLSERVAPAMPRGNINEYKAVLLSAIPDLPTAEVFVSRYGLSFKPWLNWAGTDNPVWWRSYNNVKHERDAYFQEATLKNSLDALGALLLLTFHLYSRVLAVPPEVLLAPKDANGQLDPPSALMRLDESLYYSPLIV